VGVFKKVWGSSPDREIVDGLIGYFNLTDWRLTTFPKEQRDWIETEYQRGLLDFGDSNPRPLTAGKIESCSKARAHILTEIAIILYRGGFRQQSFAVFEFAESEATCQQDYISLHFAYHHLIELNYRDREKVPGAIEAAIEACLKQISLAPKAEEAFLAEYRFDSDGGSLPRPLGYYQLAIIREKAGNFSEAIRLSKLALEQGWAGDWEKRITRLEKKLRNMGVRKDSPSLSQTPDL